MSRGAVDRYNAKTYDQISVRIKKDLARDFKEKCEDLDISQSSVITKAIQDFCEKKSPS